MPKFSKEMEEKILELIEQDYKNAEISRELGVYRGAVAKRRKEHEKQKLEQNKPEPGQYEIIQQEKQESPPLDPKSYTRNDGVALSDSAMSRLYQLHTLLGSNSIEAMIETVYSDYVVVDKLWLEYKEYSGASKTFAFIIAEEKGYAADLKHDLDIYMEEFPEDQRRIEELKAKAEKQYDEGYRNGKNDQALLVPCTSCGQPITIESGTEVHRHIVEFCRELGIIHNDCIPRYKRIFA